MFDYLDIGFYRCRQDHIALGYMLNPLRLVSLEGGGNLDSNTQGRTPHEDRGLGWSCIYKPHRVAGITRDQETNNGAGSPPQSLQRNQPYKHLNFRFIIVGESISAILAPQFVCICKAAIGDTLGRLYASNYSQNI